VVDTGSPITVLDKSLAPKLGPLSGTMTINSFYGKQQAAIYQAPKLSLGGVALMTGSNLLTLNLKKMFSRSETPILGVIGMDCLRHYCLQLDFKARKIRFLQPARSTFTNFGKAYPLQFSQAQGDLDAVSQPLIQHAGLLGGTATNSEIDTGNNMDGMAEASLIEERASGSYTGSLVSRVKHFMAVKGIVHESVGNLSSTWDGNTYTDLAVSRAPHEAPSWIGLRFLARHLVTFDFPNHTLYLKQTTIGPILNPPEPPPAK
jgi:hypothetical protein